MDGQAGRVKVHEHLKPLGYAYHHASVKRASFDASLDYEYTILPSIKSISVNRGSIAGNALRIEGGGFSNLASDISVSVDETPCVVHAPTDKVFHCILQQQVTATNSNLSTNATSQVKGFKQGVGMLYTRHSYSGYFNSYISAARAGTPTVL